MPRSPDPEPQSDDSDILHAVVGEKALEIVLRQGEEHAENPGNEADYYEKPTPPIRRDFEEANGPQQTINPVLIMTPDMTADTGLGAAGCASGSQT